MSEKCGCRVASFLVRLWLEPREVEGKASPLRGYIRYLQTGEEHYFSDPEMIVEYVLRQLQDDMQSTCHRTQTGSEDDPALKEAATNTWPI